MYGKIHKYKLPSPFYLCEHVVENFWHFENNGFFSNNSEPQKVRQKRCELYYYMYFCITLCLLLKLF